MLEPLSRQEDSVQKSLPEEEAHLLRRGFLSFAATRTGPYMIGDVCHRYWIQFLLHRAGWAQIMPRDGRPARCVQTAQSPSPPSGGMPKALIWRSATPVTSAGSRRECIDLFRHQKWWPRLLLQPLRRQKHPPGQAHHLNWQPSGLPAAAT